MKHKLMTFVLLSLVAFGAGARTLYVNSWSEGGGTAWTDATSLSNAVKIAAASDEPTEIRVREGDYPLAGELFVSNVTVTIRGGYAGVGETRGAASTVYRDNSVAAMRLVNAWDSTVTLDTLTFTNAYATTTCSGLALYLNNCTTVMTNCNVCENNSLNATVYGAIYVKAGSFNAYDCDISRNTYRDNYSHSMFGGGLYLTGLPTVELHGCSVSTNRFVAAGGTFGCGLYANEAASLIISNCTFAGNYGRRSQGSWTQRAAYGGAIYYSMSTWMTSVFDVIDTRFEGNWLNNGAYTPGGALYLSSNGHNQGKHPINMTRCVFKDNGKRATDDPDAGTENASDAGDLYYASAYWKLTLTNCIFVGTPHRNSAYFTSYTDCIRCTFANAGDGYGFYAGSTIRMYDSIVWGNAAGGIDIKQGASITIAYSDVQDDNAGTGNFCVDPQLSTDGWAHLLSKAGYYANGGFAGGTLAYAAVDSPCIDAGDPARSVDLEPQPNRHLPNIGGYAGTAAASRTTLGSDPVVHPDRLQVFAWDLVAAGEGATLRGEVASTGGGTNPELYAVYGDEDVPGATSLDDWDYHTLVGTYAPWEPASADIPGSEGTTYCRLAVKSEKGLVFSDPVLSFVQAKPPTVSLAKVIRVQRATAQIQLAISADGGADTTLRCRYWKTADGETAATTVDLNDGLVVATGTTYEYALSGLSADTEYTFSLEAVNGAGTTAESFARTTLSNAARTFYVTTTGAGDRDGQTLESAFGNVQSALDAATANGDVISLSAGSHVGSQPNVTELSTLYISYRTGLTLRGDPNGGTVLTIGSEDVRIFHGYRCTMTFEDLTFRGGRCWQSYNYGGAVKCNYSTFTFNRCVFEDNGIPDSGQSGGYQYGGACGSYGGVMHFSKCIFRRNSVCSNAGVCCSYGGAVYGGTMSFADCTFQTNMVCGYGNGSCGGAIYATGGTLSITNCIFVGNHAQKTRSGSTGWGGGYAPFGGALYITGGADAKITESDFDGNYMFKDNAIGNGGLAYIAGAATRVLFDRCRVTNGGVSGLADYPEWDSGAIALPEGRLTLVNTLFAGGHSNAVEVTGGTLVATNVTIAGNDGYGLYQSAGSATFVNSILWGNARGVVTNGAPSIAFDHSDVQTNGLGAIAAADGNFQKDPKFVGEVKGKGEGQGAGEGEGAATFLSLQAAAYKLRSSSPCIEAGANADWMSAATDLDGNARIRYSRVDLGCFECEKHGLLLLVK